MSIMTENEKLLLEAKRCMEQGDETRALVACDELLKRDISMVDALFIAGTVMLRADQNGIGAQLFNAARAGTADKRKLGAIWNNLGCCLQDYQPAEAYRAFKKALEYGHEGVVYDNLCNVASQLGRHAEALDFASKCTVQDPAYNKSFALFALGRWAEGWAEYAKSIGHVGRPMTDRNYGLPRWDGKKPGRVILHGEQGIGDELMFMSMCPRDWDGVIECNARNESLFARSFPNAAVYGTLGRNELEWPLTERCDYHLEMGGLGEFYAPQPFAGPAFLTPDPARMAGWKAWLAASAGHGKRVGISWTGGAWSTGRQRRTLPFDLIRKKLFEQHPDVTWVCLEYDDRREELEQASAETVVLNPHWATRKGADIDDLAALVRSLDLVITATNSTVDVCGSVGVPVWAMVDAQPQWRYALAAGDDAMWFYESARCFRQRPEDNGSWERVVNNVTTELHKLKMPTARPNGRPEPLNDGWVSC